MKDKELMTIGEASRLTGMHVKSLRYYDRMGVFRPEYVDAKSGYRYYSFEQLQGVIAVMTCLGSGIVLSELEKYRDEESTDYLSLIRDAEAGIEKEIRILEKRKRYLSFLEDEVIFNSEAHDIRNNCESFGSVAFWRIPVRREDMENSSRKEMFIRLASEAEKSGFQVNPLYFGMLMTQKGEERGLYAIAGLDNFLDIEEKNENIFRLPEAKYRRALRPDLDVTDAEKVFPELFALDYDKTVLTTIGLSKKNSGPVYSMFINLPD